MHMEWETPAFTEIDMSAEIGAYQSDEGPQEPPTSAPVPDEA